MAQAAAIGCAAAWNYMTADREEYGKPFDPPSSIDTPSDPTDEESDLVGSEARDEKHIQYCEAINEDQQEDDTELTAVQKKLLRLMHGFEIETHNSFDIDDDEIEDETLEGFDDYEASQDDYIHTRTIEDIIEDCVKSSHQGRSTIQYEKEGNYADANEDFDSLELTDIRFIYNGKFEGRYGKLPDRRMVIVRDGSTTHGSPTLEIQAQSAPDITIKIRYIL